MTAAMRLRAAAALACLLLLGGCSAAADEADAVTDAGITAPPTGGFDYQLGGAYPPPAGTAIVVRDSTEPPAPGTYGICYLNGYQSQPGDAEQWDGLLLESGGAPVADPAWPDEFLLDTSTAALRESIAARMAPAIRACRDSGYDAVEFDNLDSYSRSDGHLLPEHNLALARDYLALAHDSGLAVAQKNTVELAGRARQLGFDFAISEECGEYAECDDYAAVYDQVLDIEYGDAAHFDELCRRGALPPDALLRDRDLAPASAAGHLFRRCG